jgi:hypothetical protein
MVTTVSRAATATEGEVLLLKEKQNSLEGTHHSAEETRNRG